MHKHVGFVCDDDEVDADEMNVDENLDTYWESLPG